MSLHEQFEILRNGKEGSLEYELALVDVTTAVETMKQKVEETVSVLERRVDEYSKRLDGLEIRNSRKTRRFGIV